MLSQVGFPGAAAGVLLDVSPVLGLIVFCLAAALGIGWAGRDLDAGHRAESAAVGSILAFSLGLGLLFFRLYAGSAAGIYSFLFGTILGISDRDVQLTLAVAVLSFAALALIGRPLVFATVDPDVAEARGVNVQMLSIGFLVVLAFAVAITVQIVGTLLIFALLVAPGASALQLTARPGRALALSVALSLAFTWLGLALAYFTDLPVGFFITSLAFAASLGGLLAGLNLLIGVFGSCIAVALAIGTLGGRGRGRDIAIGTVFAWVLGVGVLFLSLYITARSAATGSVGVSVLFGSILGLQPFQVVVASITGIATCIVTLVVARPLLFLSVDPDVALARGVPTHALTALFLVLLAVTVAESVQAVGALLIFGLMVTPAAIAQNLSA